MIDLDELDRMSKREGLIKLSAKQVRELVEELRLLRAVESGGNDALRIPGGEYESYLERLDEAIAALDAWRAGR